MEQSIIFSSYIKSLHKEFQQEIKIITWYKKYND